MLRRKTATYALLSLYEIAQQQRGSANPVGVRAGEIAHKHKMPKAYAAKILSSMANAGVLHSDRGPHGGFKLNRPVEDISLYDVFDSVGAVESSKAHGPFVNNLPPTLENSMTRAYSDAADALKGVFAKVHLADILR